MKHKIVIRFLSLILAGIMMAGNPIQVFAAEIANMESENYLEKLLPEKEVSESGEALEEEKLENLSDEVSEIPLPEEKIEETKDETPDVPVEETEKKEETTEKTSESLPEEKGTGELNTEKPSESPVEEVDNAPELMDNIPETEQPNALSAIDVTRIELSESFSVMNLGESKELGVTLYNGDRIVEAGFSVTSSDSSIVEVEGLNLNAKKAGTAMITVSAVSNPTIKEVCEVKVIIPIEAISLNEYSLNLKRGQSVNVIAVIYPENTTESRALTWKSSDLNVAEVGNDGKITAKSSGKAIITVETSNGLTATLDLTVSSEEWLVGWQLIDGKWYYYDQNGIKKTDWLTIGKYQYYLGADGVMRTGWQFLDGKYYYFDKGGPMLKGWLTVGKYKYYLGTDGVMRTGWQLLDGKYYYFDKGGPMLKGWLTIGKYQYYLGIDGVMRTGWQLLDGKYYYFDKGGPMLKGWLTIGKYKYYLGTDGVMRTGWQLLDGKYYYFDKGGPMLKGWLTIGKYQYYLGTDGVMRTGWQLLDGKYYYFDKGGPMLKGWLTIGKYQYYLGTDGVMRTGWQLLDGKYYYFDKGGPMLKGWLTIGTYKYYLGTDGVMRTGWQLLDGKYYYFDKGGPMLKGWLTIGTYKYYLGTDGVMRTGWQLLNGKYYYFDSSGMMKTGWIKSGNNWYYLNSNGVMVTSDTQIDGKLNQFSSDGVWKGIVSGNIKKYGIDVSSHQGSINWKSVADDDIDFAMIRVVTGKGSSMERDDRFKENYDGARKYGIDVGVYKYSYATSRTQARAEAEAVIKALNGRKLDYPIVLDVEDSSILNGTDSDSRRSEIILAFKDEIEDAGYKFALYANSTWLNNYLDMSMLKNVDIWIARWRSLDKGHGYTGKGNVTMWQYSNSGKVDGISGNVDLNVSYKDY